MQITDVEILEYLMSSAMAAYSEFNNDEFKDALVNKGFTETQADEFIKRYDLIDHLPNQASGFSATVFWDKIDQKHVIAFRGTETDIQGIYSDVLNADILGIGGRGFAVDQAIDLYRYWRQLTTPAGQSVNYSLTELWQLYALKMASAFAVSGIADASFLFWQQTFGGDVGLLDEPLDAGASVTAVGHSLGGHLAMLFARFFPSNAEAVVTLNAPDFYSHGQVILNLAGFPVPPGYDAQIVQLNAEGDQVTRLGNIVPGTQIGFAQETTNVVDNHRSANGVDALNLLSLLATIDPTLSQQIKIWLSNFIYSILCSSLKNSSIVSLDMNLSTESSNKSLYLRIVTFFNSIWLSRFESNKFDIRIEFNKFVDGII